MKALVILYILCFCLNLSQAQITSPPYTPTPTAAPPATEIPPTATPSGALNSITNSVQPVIPPAAAGKYEEFQSICRTADYDLAAHYVPQLKNIRISILNERIRANPEAAKPRLKLLKELVDQKKIKEAEAVLRELKAKRISVEDKNIADATYAFLKGDKKVSRDLLNKVVASNPKNIDALKILAEVYKAELNYFEATSIYFDLSKMTTENFDDQLCETYTLDAIYTEAEPYCFKSVAKNKNPFAHIYLGVGAREQNKLKEARKYFNSSLKVKDTEMAHVCLGELSILEKKYSEAIGSLRTATTLIPTSDRAFIALAWALFNDKQRPKALENFQTACVLNKKTIVEVRRALKILLDEKSEHINPYSQLVQRCEIL